VIGSRGRFFCSLEQREQVRPRPDRADELPAQAFAGDNAVAAFAAKAWAITLTVRMASPGARAGSSAL
jgi:hypothetical protein